MTTFQARLQAWGPDRSMIVGLTLLHLGALLAFVPAFFSWDGLIVGLILFWVSGSLGISITYHRLLTHGAFTTSRWFKYFLTGTALLAAQRGPLRWVADHRRHHAHSDEEGDPHSPRDGFFWAHMLWLIPDEVPEAKTDAYFTRWVPDLYKDAGMRWLDRNCLLIPFGIMPILFVLGHFFGTSGMSWLVWGGFVRTVALLHITYFVNSASHTWGYRNYKTRDTSTNLWWVGLLGHGEGWHNNHHAFQSSANFGHRWWEFDASFLVIRFFGLLGLAKNIKTPKYGLAERRKLIVEAAENALNARSPELAVAEG